MHVFTYASMTQLLDKAQLKALGGESRWVSPVRSHGFNHPPD